MRKPDFPMALATLCLAAITLSGCGLWWGRRSVKTTEDEVITGLEAHRMLADARSLLYVERAAHYERAIRIADFVILRCDEPQYVWRAYYVKALAYQMTENHVRASQTGSTGIVNLLTANTGEIPREAMSILKMLLVAYVESSVPSQGADKTLSQLEKWKTELQLRHEKGQDPDALAVITDLFKPLEAMAREYAAAQRGDEAIQSLIREFIVAFNRDDAKTILDLIAPESALAQDIKKQGMAALRSKPCSLHTISAVEVRFDSGKPEKSQATARCKLLLTSPAGWAREVPEIAFQLVKTSEKQWLIESWSGKL
jgi:hypothetical protein